MPVGTGALDYAKVADLYDSYVPFDRDVAFFLGEIQAAKGPVLELMAGTGRLSIPLLRAGADLTCVDASDEMLEILRGKLAGSAQTADVICQDACDLKLGRTFAMALLPFHAIAEVRNPKDRARLFSGVRNALDQDGRFVLTLHNPAVRRRSLETRQLHRLPLKEPLSGTLEFEAELVLDGDRVRGVQRYRVLDGSGTLQEERVVPIEFALLEPEDVEADVLAAGFSLEAKWGDYDRSAFGPASPYAIWRFRAVPRRT